jgi:23S rRNA pseudouridine955/2504/2580 synthase/23S rRNA pseudouridine1911/1915/1917 synthase
MNRNVSIQIRAEDAGCAVLEFLSRRFTYYDRNRWETIIREEKVWLNGKPPFPDTLLAPRDTLAYVGFGEIEPPVRIDYDILHEDEALLVVNKPGNLPCHPGGRYFRHTLWHLLTVRYGETPLHLVNRIDRETSGLVLVAKSPLAAKDCGRQFAEGSVQKRYLVAVFGDFPAETVCAEGGLCRDDTSPIHKKQCFWPLELLGRQPHPVKTCRTDFKCLRRTGGLSLLAAEPLTGRLHQIRATLYSLGYPVVGDKIYGPDDTLFLRFIEECLTAEDKKRLLLPRQALHAESLQFRHPGTGRHMHWTAPLPEDMAHLFQCEDIS